VSNKSISFCALLLCLSSLPLTAQHGKVIPELNHTATSPLRALIHTPPVFSVPEYDDESREAAAAPVGFFDPLIQKAASIPLAAVPGMSVLGLGTGFTGPSGSYVVRVVPPDPNAAVGATQIVETVNLFLAVFDKSTGSVLLGPLHIAAVWKSLGAACANNLADPMVLYDKQAGRWLLNIHTLTTPYVACLAVSQTSDATGAWYVYSFPINADGLLTTQKLGIWPDGYYLSTWTTTNSVYIGPAACVMDRSRMLVGKSATLQCIQIDNAALTGMLPSDMDGPNPPPAGSPNYFLVEGPPHSNTLYLYRLHADFSNPANTTLTGPIQIAVAPYLPLGQVPQPGTTQLLNTNSVTLKPRLPYRNFPNATPPHESLLAAHSVLTGKASAPSSGMRWYELRNPGSTPVVYQQGTYAPDSSCRWMGSIAMDDVGDIALGYGVTSPSLYPSLAYTGRVPTDPLGSMEAESVIVAGAGYQSGSDRWGDYSSMSVDPVDDCTMWYTGEYLAATGANVWATRLFSFHFPSCTATDGAAPGGDPSR
jgi:hypothetical protein